MKIWQRWKQTALHNKALVLSGILVSFGTLFYAGAAVVQICILKRSTEESTQAAQKIQDALDTANIRNGRALRRTLEQSREALDASRDASRTDQRAWMDMIINTPPNFQEDRPFTASAQMKNIGKTPARQIQLGYIFEGIIPSNHQIFDDHGLKFVNAGMLPPQGSATGPVEITPGKPDELLGKGRFEAIRDGKIVAYYWGLINYDDVFGFHHWLKFCYIYNVAHRRFDLVSTHNEIDEETR